MKSRILALTCCALLLLSACAVPTVAPTRSPLAGWDPMPTRAPTPTPRPASSYLQEMDAALLRGDLAAATVAWEQAQRLAPVDSDILQAGARLALTLGYLELAERRAQAAVAIAPQDAAAWVLLGTIQQRRGQHEQAQESLETAQSLDPTLARDLFAARWQNARRAHDADMLAALAQAYLVEQPDDPLASYFRAEAFLAAGNASGALHLLVLEMGPDSPAVLWYTLGRCYLARGANAEARIALEAAATAYAHGDNSLLLASDDPQRDLDEALGWASEENDK